MTTTIALTKNATNAELTQAFGEQLNDGKTRVFCIEESKTNDKRVTLFLCQQIKTQTSANEVQKFFLGWGQGTRIIRTVLSAEKTLVAQNNIKEGSVVPFDILVEEKCVYAYPGQSQKVNPSTGEVITYEGRPVFEHSSLVPAGQGAKVITLERNTAPVSSELPENPFIS